MTDRLPMRLATLPHWATLRGRGSLLRWRVQTAMVHEDAVHAAALEAEPDWYEVTLNDDAR